MYVLTYAFFQPFILNYTLTYKCIKPLQVQGLTYVKVKSVPEVYRILKQVMHVLYLFIPHVKIEFNLVCPSSALPGQRVTDSSRNQMQRALVALPQCVPALTCR